MKYEVKGGASERASEEGKKEFGEALRASLELASGESHHHEEEHVAVLFFNTRAVRRRRREERGSNWHTNNISRTHDHDGPTPLVRLR